MPKFVNPRSATLYLSCISFLALVAGPSAIAGASAASLPEDPAPIRLAMNEWSSQNLLTQIAGRILERTGYKVEYVAAGYTAQLPALQSGDLTASMEVWETNVGEGFGDMVKEGKLDIVSENGLKGGGGWVYPEYVEAMCPGLPDWKALQKCAKIFATAETLPHGQLVDFPPEWGNMHTGDRLASLGIDLKPVSGGSEGAMLAVLRSSVATKKPALVYLWWPHPIFSELKLAHVDLPAWSPECETDPKWGPNPNATFDCGEAPGRIMVVAWAGMQQKWPVAYRILKNFKFDNQEDMNLSYSIEQGKKVGDVADDWLASHSELWQRWVSQAKAS